MLFLFVYVKNKYLIFSLETLIGIYQTLLDIKKKIYWFKQHLMKVYGYKNIYTWRVKFVTFYATIVC